MSPFYRLMLALVISAFMTVGCQTSALQTITPAEKTPISPTSTPISAMVSAEIIANLQK